MKSKSFIFLFVLVFMIIVSLSAVSADDLQTTDSGEVSGDVDVTTVNPWNTHGELSYDIPSDAKDIKSAGLYVNVYGGSAKNTHGANANVSLTTGDGEKQIASEQLWIEDGSTDGTIYPVNNHTTKCYSDYQMHYDLTDSLKDLNGSSITIKVDTFEMENKTFDGRIKLIALIFAYDDGDLDKISYFVDSTQKWTKTNITTDFNTGNVEDVVAATVTNIALSSADGSFKFNDELMGDPVNHTAGNYYQYSSWDVTDKFKQGQNSELISMNAGTSTYASLKNVLTILKLESKKIEAEVSLATEYTSVNTCYAGTNNTLTIKVNSNKKGNYVVELLADGTVVDTSDVTLDGENQSTILLTDPTIRTVDETTVNGANNSNVVYSVNVKYGDFVVADANKTVPVLYNGNLGKDLAYNASYIEDLQTIVISGDVVIDIKDSGYMSAATTNRTDIWNIDLGDKSSVVKAFVYVSYNWDKSGNEGPVFNVTFNGKDITAKAQYRDQSNLGNYGKYGYGLFVYDVSDLIASGNNTLILIKENGKTAVYPSSLIYLTNNTESKYLTTVYIEDGADLLANSNNNAGRIVSTGNSFNVNADKLVSANLYVLAASAQKGEGNLIFNGNETLDIWNGTSNSVEVYSSDISNSIVKSNEVSFVATGSTILALNQILTVKTLAPIKTTLTATKLSTTYDSGKTFTVKVIGADKKPVVGLKLSLKVFTGSKYTTVTVSTNKNGIATYKSASTLAIGTHKVEITTKNTNYIVKKTTSSIKIAKAKTTVKAPKVTAKVKKSKYFKVTVKNKATKKVVKNIKIKVKVYTGKKYKTYNIKTNKKGVAQLNTKKLKVGKHKVVVSSGNAKYTLSAKSTIVIKK